MDDRMVNESTSEESGMVRKTLGRGLQSLLGLEEGEGFEEVSTDAPMMSSDQSELRHIPVIQVDPNPYQPRREFGTAELGELAQSIRTHGVIQPVVVRYVHDRYQLIAGERRWRAAQQAGLEMIPARVVELDDQRICEVALVENLQRQDLNPMEKAEAFRNYLQRFETTHDSLAEHLGVDRSTVTNLLRLLDLPNGIQDAVRSGKISNGHARALSGLSNADDQSQLCQQILDQGMSVRQTELAVRQQKSQSIGRDLEEGEPAAAAEKESAPAASVEKSNHLVSLENEIRQRLGVKVEIRQKSPSAGQVMLHFESLDDFERIVGSLTRG